MKRFLLLRDHQELGPFTLEELRLWGLKEGDLVWIEGISIAWDYPANISDLKGLASPPVTGLTIPHHAAAGLPNTAETFPTYPSEEADLAIVSPAGPEKSTETADKPASGSFIRTYGLWLAALAVVLAGTTWLMKEAVDVFSGKRFTKSKITHVAAPLRTLPEGVSPIRDEDATVQNAISREIVPVDTIEAKEPVKKKPRLKELKKYLQVESNDYKVGVFGGINDLRLTIVNNSAYELDKVVLQVDYLKPKGETIESEKYTYFSIPAHGKKTLDIPPSKRGVKVKYRVVDAKSREYKVALVPA
ncbi:MAG TPA: hypothetical protein VGE66_08600 [Chitinophagaceae bacterium]